MNGSPNGGAKGWPVTQGVNMRGVGDGSSPVPARSDERSEDGSSPVPISDGPAGTGDEAVPAPVKRLHEYALENGKLLQM